MTDLIVGKLYHFDSKYPNQVWKIIDDENLVVKKEIIYRNMPFLLLDVIETTIYTAEMRILTNGGNVGIIVASIKDIKLSKTSEA